MKTGVLLVNLGTPDAPRAPEVRRYLREFLSDPKVIDIPAVPRWLLVNGIIAPFRAPKSAEAYRQVWTERGSPLLFHSLDLRDAVQERLADVPVQLGMRYGSPSIADALDRLKAAGAERLVCIPLYPQFADSSTGSSIEAVERLAAERWATPQVEFIPAFHSDERFLDAFAAVGKPVLEEFQPDHVLFSYHGLPERHCRKTDLTGKHCFEAPNCCDAIVEANQNCYRAHCVATTRGLQARLGRDDTNSSYSFQSRLGRDPWIKPYTDEVVKEFGAAGIKRLAVFCPAFVADCLETLEEIGMRAEDDFKEAGGEALRLVPSLNASPAWVDALTGMLGDQLDSSSVPTP